MTGRYSVTARPGLGVVGSGRGSFLKSFAIKTGDLEREPIVFDPTTQSYSDLLPFLGGTPITASLGCGRDLLTTTTDPTD